MPRDSAGSTEDTPPPETGERRRRPRITRQNRAYEDASYPWNLGMVPPTLMLGGKEIPHPALNSAIFVVHGIGAQTWTSTSANLRSHFEDTLLAIREWQKKHPDLVSGMLNPVTFPPPFVLDGFWSDYADLEKTFPEEWNRFTSREQQFFTGLWKQRTHSIPRLFRWFLIQQLRLLRPSVLREVGFFRWLLYIPLQAVVPAVLTLATLRYRRLFTEFLSDVRLYLNPRGIVERAIVQRIDYRVGAQFLSMLGLDWAFLPLPDADRLIAGGKPTTFDRVVWVSHSLGTVISFNVLSDLLHRAVLITSRTPNASMSAEEQTRLAQQQEGVRRFRVALEHFITLGSPLEKVAFLFPGSLRPWPSDPSDEEQRFDWANFHHVLDPVSGRLQHERLVAGRKPFNYHIRTGWIPGVAHIAYWRDLSTLRFILSRMYGKRVLRDQDYVQFNPIVQKITGLIAYFVWAALLGVSAYYATVKFWPWLVRGGGVVWRFLKL